MKKLFVSTAVLSTLVFGVSVIGMAQSKPDFSGTWVLDTKKTHDLPADLKSYTLTVTQDQQRITFESKVDGDLTPQPKPDSSGAVQEAHVAVPHPTASTTGIQGATLPSNENGPGTSNSRTVMARGRALGLVIRHMTCTLDGKEVAREVGGLSPGQIRRKALWKKGDKSLEFNLARDFDFQGSKVTSTVKELWELSEDGKVLKIKRTVNLLAGWDETTLVFNKQ